MNDLIVKAAARALRRQAGERSVLAPECTLEGQVADMLELLLVRAKEAEVLAREVAKKDELIQRMQQQNRETRSRIAEVFGENRRLHERVRALEAELEDHRQSNFCDYGCLDDEKGGA